MCLLSLVFLLYHIFMLLDLLSKGLKLLFIVLLLFFELIFVLLVVVRLVRSNFPIELSNHERHLHLCNFPDIVDHISCETILVASLKHELLYVLVRLINILYENAKIVIFNQNLVINFGP